MTYKELSNEFNINIKQVDKFLNYLLATNKKMNLTAITDKEEIKNISAGDRAKILIYIMDKSNCFNFKVRLTNSNCWVFISVRNNSSIVIIHIKDLIFITC